MAKRSKKNSEIDGIVWFLAIITLGVIFLVKCTIKIIVWIFNKIAESTDKKEKKIEEKVVEKLASNKERFNVSDINVIERLNIFDKKKYNDLFPVQIRIRGENYYESGKIYNYKKSNNKYSCIIKGSHEYNVSISFKKGTDEIINASCTCPYFSDKNQKCKHIYALLYKIKCENNKEKIIKEIDSILNDIEKMIDNSIRYIDNNKSNFPKNDIKEFQSYIHKYDLYFRDVKSNLNNNTLETTLINYFERLLYISYELDNRIEKTLNSEITDSNNNFNKTSIEEYEENISEYTDEELDDYELEDWQKDLVKSGEYDPWDFEEYVEGNDFSDEINYIKKMEDIDEEDENDSEYTDEELRNYGLENWQIEEVKKCNYDPWNFEEEDLEEEDYYYEDD